MSRCIQERQIDVRLLIENRRGVLERTGNGLAATFKRKEIRESGSLRIRFTIKTGRENQRAGTGCKQNSF